MHFHDIALKRKRNFTLFNGELHYYKKKLSFVLLVKHDTCVHGTNMYILWIVLSGPHHSLFFQKRNKTRKFLNSAYSDKQYYF